MLDLDALGAAEKENWVWKGSSCLAPDYKRCLLSLSRGGADAAVLREFDTQARRFVEAQDGGFVLAEAKSSIDWIDDNTVYVATDFGAGSLTDSGYPRIVKRWQRGTPLAKAVTVFEGQAKDVAAGVSVDRTPGFERTVFSRATDFYNSQRWLLQGERQVAIDLPSDAELSFWRERMLIQLRSDWTFGDKTWPRGSLLAADAEAYLAGRREFTALFTPSATRSLAGFATTYHHVLLSVLDNVAGRVEEWSADGTSWQRREVKAPFPGTLGVQSLHDPMLGERDPLAEQYLLSYADFLTPDSLMLATGRQRCPRDAEVAAALFRQRRHARRAALCTLERRHPGAVLRRLAARRQGRRQATRRCSTATAASRSRSRPATRAASAAPGTPQGGVLVVANIRGGGEFGPAWHQAARRRPQAEQLRRLRRRGRGPDRRADHVADAPRHQGGSNGGLLVGAVMLQRPELFGAVVCQVPLLDMRRYHQLLAGASWMAEYGDPDKPDDWAFISKYSPYQNVRRGMKLPTVLFITSTRDDRVHPGHARKMAARMAEQGHALLYYENIEGGHGGAADNEQRADMMALRVQFSLAAAGAPGMIDIKHDPTASRFEATVEGQRCVCHYRTFAKVMMLTHTAVPHALRGRGIAAALVKAALDHARESGLKVRPDCSYVEAYMLRHPETQDLL